MGLISTAKCNYRGKQAQIMFKKKRKGLEAEKGCFTKDYLIPSADNNLHCSPF